MKCRRLLVIGAVAAIAPTALGTSAASAKTALELKEEGVPVAAGSELSVELETLEACPTLTQPAHLSDNGARQDVLAVERPVTEEVFCPHEDEFVSFDVSGGIQEIEMTTGGRAKLRGSPLRFRFTNDFGPAISCMYELRKFSGTFRVPGAAHIEGSAVARLNRHESREEKPPAERCRHSQSIHFAASVDGHNNKPLEAEDVV
jgi:hypothetical protein